MGCFRWGGGLPLGGLQVPSIPRALSPLSSQQIVLTHAPCQKQQSPGIMGRILKTMTGNAFSLHRLPISDKHLKATVKES